MILFDAEYKNQGTSVYNPGYLNLCVWIDDCRVHTYNVTTLTFGKHKSAEELFITLSQHDFQFLRTKATVIDSP